MADDLTIIGTGDLPTVITSSGLVPTPPAVLRAQLVQIVALTNPGYTANLPGTLIEDIASTDTQAMVLIDQARVEALNSLTPYGCNEFVLMLLGKVYGVPIGQPANTSVFVIFTGLPGFVIAKGFVVSDGTYQYIVQDGGVVGTDGRSPPLYCVANAAGTWAVPPGTVTLLVTPPPQGFSLSVINPEPGIPAQSAETATSYRSRVLRAGLAASQGMARYLRTLLSNVQGVQDRLIGIKQIDGGGWMIMVGGGDPVVVAYTIYQALFDISELVGSTIHVLGITQASPAVVTTDLNHAKVPGSDIVISNSNPAVYNGHYAVIASDTEKTFKLGTRYPADQITALSWAAIGPPTNGALTQVATGALAAATYFVRSTWVTATGETLPGAETSLAVAINNVLRVAAPAAAPTLATGWNVYVSTATGTETKQNAVPIALGTAWQQPTTGLIPGAALPAASTAGGLATATFLSNTGVTAGSVFALLGSVPAGWNGSGPAVTAVANTITFALPTNPGAATTFGQLQAGIANFNSTALAPYVNGAIIEPNDRNLSVSIVDFPDTYLIKYVVPPLQQVSGTVIWNTNSPYFVSPAAVAQLAAPALANYINSIVVGEPINLLRLGDAFQAAIVSVLPPTFLSVLEFHISINGIGTLPDAGSQIIEGDPQSFFFAQAADFSIVQA